MTLRDRVERLERLARPAPVVEPLSPERRAALMLRLQAVGLAAWDEEHQRWYPPHPQLLRRLLRERAEMRLPHGEATP
jgi:hypothetical protein